MVYASQINLKYNCKEFENEAKQSYRGIVISDLSGAFNNN